MGLIVKGVRFLRAYGPRAALREAARRLGSPAPAGERARPLPYRYSVEPVRYRYGSAAADPPPAPGRINWVVPNFHGAAGGHRTIFRLTRALEEAGYEVRFHILGPTHYSGDSEATQFMRTHYFPLKATVHLGVADMPPAEFCVASQWETAYAVRDFGACRRKIYFVQDWEPSFYPAGTERALAEDTYRFGFECVCAGRWLARKVREYGNRAASFDLAYDPAVYHPAPVPYAGNRVVFYTRPKTPRRGAELGLLALALLKARRPDVEVVLFGSESLPYELPFDCTRAGVLGEHELAGLYRGAAAGLSISLSNYSLVPQEMLACGLPVVEVNHPSLREAYPAGGRGIRLVAPTPESIADALSEVLAPPEAEMRRARRDASRLVSHLSWEAAGQTLVEFLGPAKVRVEHARERRPPGVTKSPANGRPSIPDRR